MKPKVLFILGVLDSGGVAKSLVSLLNTIDRDKYEISLLLCSKDRGPFYELLPKNVKIITDETLAAVSSVLGLKHLLYHGHFGLFLGSILRMIVSRFSKAYSGYILSRLMPVVTNDEYDLIVDYNGQQQTYYMVDKLKAKMKVAFFHNDYEKWPYYYAMDKKYYPKLDAIFTISQICVDSLKRYFPDQKNKIELMENISSPQVIHALAQEIIDFPFSSTINLLSVGHICERKGFHFSITAGKILKDHGIDFCWYFIGNTTELHKYEQQIRDAGIKDSFVFLGLKSNPYPYFKAVDIVVHPSLFEGKSVTLDEAKILCKPIVVTNFSTVYDQFEDRVNASICDMNGESLANAIEELIRDTELRKNYVNYLSEHIVDNSGEVEKIYALL